MRYTCRGVLHEPTHSFDRCSNAEHADAERHDVIATPRRSTQSTLPTASGPTAACASRMHWQPWRSIRSSCSKKAAAAAAAAASSLAGSRALRCCHSARPLQTPQLQGRQPAPAVCALAASRAAARSEAQLNWTRTPSSRYKLECRAGNMHPMSLVFIREVLLLHWSAQPGCFHRKHSHAAGIGCVQCAPNKSANPSATGAGWARPAQDRGRAPGGRIGSGTRGRCTGLGGAGGRACGGAGCQEGGARRAAAGGDRGGRPAGRRRRHRR